MTIPKTLTIAGSDSGGGAGIQADLKTFSALGCYGMSVLTALTAQNTRQVTAIHGVPADFIRDQIDAVFSDIGVDAVKIGMLHSSEVIREVASSLGHYQPEHLVVDPVMVAKSGDRLLQDDAVAALKEHLIPMATLITPNLPECEVLTGRPVTDRKKMEEAGRELLKMGPAAVLVKGGHLSDESISPDCLVFYDSHHTDPGKKRKDAGAPDDSDKNSDRSVAIRWFELPRIDTRNNHGTGCTLSSALAAGLARQMTLEEAVNNALNYLNQALKHAVNWKIGNGHGPVHHFYHWWNK